VKSTVESGCKLICVRVAVPRNANGRYLIRSAKRAIVAQYGYVVDRQRFDLDREHRVLKSDCIDGNEIAVGVGEDFEVSLSATRAAIVRDGEELSRFQHLKPPGQEAIA